MKTNDFRTLSLKDGLLSPLVLPPPVVDAYRHRPGGSTPRVLRFFDHGVGGGGDREDPHNWGKSHNTSNVGGHRKPLMERKGGDVGVGIVSPLILSTSLHLSPQGTNQQIQNNQKIHEKTSGTSYFMDFLICLNVLIFFIPRH